MLTDKTQVDYALLELRRDPQFRQFCINLLSPFRDRYHLPNEIEQCMAIELIPGIPIARIALDKFKDAINEPQWIRERQLIANFR